MTHFANVDANGIGGRVDLLTEIKQRDFKRQFMNFKTKESG